MEVSALQVFLEQLQESRQNLRWRDGSTAESPPVLASLATLSEASELATPYMQARTARKHTGASASCN